MIATLIGSAVGGVAAWFAVNFLGKPVLALREKRLAALQIAERYSSVGMMSSVALRGTALKELHDVGNALLAFSREASTATRLWCRWMRYDLEIAAWCLFGLAEGPRGEYSISPDQRQSTLNALYVSLGSAKHLSADGIRTAKREIAAARRKQGSSPSAIPSSSGNHLI